MNGHDERKSMSETTDNKITEWLRDDLVSTSSLADYTAIDNLTWLRLEKARLLKAGIATRIVVHPEKPNVHALERIPAIQEG